MDRCEEQISSSSFGGVQTCKVEEGASDLQNYETPSLEDFKFKQEEEEIIDCQISNKQLKEEEEIIDYQIPNKRLKLTENNQEDPLKLEETPTDVLEPFCAVFVEDHQEDSMSPELDEDDKSKITELQSESNSSLSQNAELIDHKGLCIVPVGVGVGLNTVTGGWSSIPQNDSGNDTVEPQKLGKRRVCQKIVDWEDEEDIMINQVSKHDNGKRYRNKQHCCKFCHNTYISISRHLLSVHNNEVEIGRIKSLPDIERKRALEQLVREGDYYYNKQVLALGKGELILVRRPTALERKTHTYKDYAPCTSCLGFMLKTHLSHHVKSGCKEASNSAKTSFSVKLCSEALLAAGLRETFSEDFEHWVIGKLTNDETGLVCKNENILLKYGNFLFLKNQNTDLQQRAQNVRNAIRSIASIYSKVQDKKCAFNCISEMFDPEKYDLIVETVKEACRFQNISQKGDLKPRSAGVRLGFEIVKMGEFVHGLYIKKEDTVSREKVKKFIDLVKSEWNERILVCRDYEDEEEHQTAKKPKRKDYDDEEEHLTPKKPKRASIPTRSNFKRAWSEVEKSAVLQYFRNAMTQKAGVKKTEAEDCICKNSCLKGRSWLNIRDFIRNYKKKFVT